MFVFVWVLGVCVRNVASVGEIMFSQVTIVPGCNSCCMDTASTILFVCTSVIRLPTRSLPGGHPPALSLPRRRALPPQIVRDTVHPLVRGGVQHVPRQIDLAADGGVQRLRTHALRRELRHLPALAPETHTQHAAPVVLSELV